MTTVGKLVAQKRALTPLSVNVCYYELIEQPLPGEATFFKLNQKSLVLFRPETAPVPEDKKGPDGSCQLPLTSMAGCLSTSCWQTAWTKVMWSVKWRAKGLQPIRPVISTSQSICVPQSKAVELTANPWVELFCVSNLCFKSCWLNITLNLSVNALLSNSSFFPCSGSSWDCCCPLKVSKALKTRHARVFSWVSDLSDEQIPTQLFTIQCVYYIFNDIHPVGSKSLNNRIQQHVLVLSRVQKKAWKCWRHRTSHQTLVNEFTQHRWLSASLNRK